MVATFFHPSPLHWTQERMSDLEILQERLQAQRNAASATPDSRGVSPPDDSDEMFPDVLSGVTRNRTEFKSDLDNIPMMLFTIEDGRAYKRHKNLSGEADADAEKFLKVFRSNN